MKSTRHDRGSASAFGFVALTASAIFASPFLASQSNDVSHTLDVDLGGANPQVGTATLIAGRPAARVVACDFEKDGKNARITGATRRYNGSTLGLDLGEGGGGEVWVGTNSTFIVSGKRETLTTGNGRKIAVGGQGYFTYHFAYKAGTGHLCLMERKGN